MGPQGKPLKGYLSRALNAPEKEPVSVSVRTEVLNGMCLAPVRRRQKAGAAEMLGGIMQREQRGGAERGADSGKRAKGPWRGAVDRRCWGILSTATAAKRLVGLGS